MAFKFGSTNISPAYTVKFGSTALKVLKIGSTEVWKKAITITNKLSAATEVKHNWSDIGYDATTYNGNAVALTKGHRYYIRAQSSTWASLNDGGFADGAAVFDGVTIASSGTGATKTNHAIVKASAASAYLQTYVHRNNSPQGGTTSTFYMIVDLTELEAAAGKTYTAETFWAAVKSAVFYGSKEISL